MVVRKGIVVKLQDHLRRLETDEITSQPDLVASISHLVDCLRQASTSKDGGQPSEHGQAISNALGAAIEAELRMADQLERIDYLERLAISDELTGLLNRRGFEDSLGRTLAAARRYGEHGVLVYIDLDGFKPINDTHGHAAGDAALRHIAGLLKDSVRPTDFVARMGGDEFAVMLTRTTWDDGLNRAEAVDRLINGTSFTWQGQLITLHASFGIQTYGPKDDGQQLLNRADEAMYRAKRLRTQVRGERARA